MHIIALTGGIATGKSTAAAMLRGFGAPIIDADRISRATTAPGGPALPDIARAFGQQVFNEDGTLNRRALADRVFTDEAARQTLNHIIHPRVTEAIKASLIILEKQGYPVAVLDVPLLYEAGMEDLANEVWVLAVSETEQLRRVMARDGLTEAEALARIQSQWPLQEKIKRANQVIDTGISPAHTEACLHALWQERMGREPAHAPAAL